MATNIVLNECERQLAHEIGEWRLIALLFECPGESWRVQASNLAKEVNDPELKAAAKAAQSEADEGLFHYVFGPGGPAPAREATYQQSVELGYLMSDLQSFYNAFAFHPRTEEAPDHVSVETSFIAYLKLKELYALRCAEPEHAAVAADAAKQFIAAHLSNMVSARLRDSGIDYLSAAASALARRVGAPAQAPSPFPIVREADTDEGFGCAASGYQPQSDRS